MSAGRGGRPHQCSQVLWVLDTVQGQQQAVGKGRGFLAQLIRIGVGQGRDQSDDPLMECPGPRLTGQDLSREVGDRDARLTRHLQEPSQIRSTPFPSHEDPLHDATSSSERLENRVDTVENLSPIPSGGICYPVSHR